MWVEVLDVVFIVSRIKSVYGINYFYVGLNKEMVCEFIDVVVMWVKVFDKVVGDIEEELFIDDG